LSVGNRFLLIPRGRGVQVMLPLGGARFLERGIHAAAVKKRRGGRKRANGGGDGIFVAERSQGHQGVQRAVVGWPL